MSDLRVQLRNVERGYAEVWVVSDEHPDFADIGTVTCITWTGTVSKIEMTKWFAHATGKKYAQRVGITFATRKAAVDALTDLFVERLGRSGRRSYGLNLKDRLRGR